MEGLIAGRKCFHLPRRRRRDGRERNVGHGSSGAVRCRGPGGPCVELAGDTAAGGRGWRVAGDGLAIAEVIETRLRTGRLLGTEEWIARQEQALARKLTPAKRGLKPQPRIQPDT
jgi:hypothetical protein